MAIVWIFWQTTGPSEPPPPTTQVQAPNLSAAPVAIPTTAPALPPPRSLPIVTKTHAEKRIPKTEVVHPPKLGTLVFEAASDVSIAVDDNEVSASEWHGYPVPVGKHRIRLTKAGFMPIENSVEVHDGKETIIRAGQ